MVCVHNVATGVNKMTQSFSSEIRDIREEAKRLVKRCQEDNECIGAPASCYYCYEAHVQSMEYDSIEAEFGDSE